MTFSYRAYGLTLESDTPVSALQPQPIQPGRYDVVMSLGFEPRWVRQARRLPSHVQHPRSGVIERENSLFKLTSYDGGKFFQLAYGGEAVFIVDAAAELLWGNCPPPLNDEDLATYLLGPVMGFLLRRRSILALHASAVCVGDQAIALCGESQTGKSTTAAALALRGIPVLCEDVTPLTAENNRFQVEPGYPRVCLWPDAVEKLFGAKNALPQLTPTWEKCFLPLDGAKANFDACRKALSAVYILAPRVSEAEAPRIEAMNSRDALLLLVQNTYMNWLLDRRQRAAEFDVLSSLVTQLPVRRIVPHADPGRIGRLCDLILADAQDLAADPDSMALLSKH